MVRDQRKIFTARRTVSRLGCFVQIFRAVVWWEILHFLGSCPFGAPSLDPLSFFTSKEKEGARKFFPPSTVLRSVYLFPSVYSGFWTEKLGINAGGCPVQPVYLLLQRTTHYDAVYSLLRARGLISMFVTQPRGSSWSLSGS
jgi:hypothetical protein